MAYSDFSLKKVKQAFNLNISELGSFLPAYEPISPSPYLGQFLEKNLRLALALNTEKARSELLICPMLLAVRELLEEKVSLFSGEDFTVDPTLGLNGICDFILTRSTEQLFIEAPVVIVVEAKKEDLKGGLGQCVAEMIAAQKFNELNNHPIENIYGTVTTGSLWKFLKLEKQTVTIDLKDYPAPPVEQILGILISLIANG